jgi:hypothetical protein
MFPTREYWTTSFCQKKVFCQDGISLSYYDSLYTPSRQDSSIEDYHADRRDVIKYISEAFEHKNYLEIGCNYDQTFDVLFGSS